MMADEHQLGHDSTDAKQHDLCVKRKRGVVGTSAGSDRAGHKQESGRNRRVINMCAGSDRASLNDDRKKGLQACSDFGVLSFKIQSCDADN